MGQAKSMRFQTEGAGIFCRFGGNENKLRSYNDSVGTGSSQARKPPPLETKLPCTLEEMYAGSTREMKISRNIVKRMGHVRFECFISSCLGDEHDADQSSNAFAAAVFNLNDAHGRYRRL